ncbi:MAG: DUF4301 family protein [Tannerellaceae bacterium]|jgi:hypothetical protein|nr:DUF4301 family protein [Tannerellaceae bacterium]
MWKSEDHENLVKRGIPVQEVESQIARFEKGFPFLKIVDSARVGCGVRVVPQDRVEVYKSEWDRYLTSGKKVVKFVPASGAASRMFKDLFAYLKGGELSASVEAFFGGIEEFAFYEELDRRCREGRGQGVPELLSSGRSKEVLSVLLSEEGMNYSQLPKGLIPFHRYAGGEIRTALEEHLVEGAEYGRGVEGGVSIHFTVSTEHRGMFEGFVRKVLPLYEGRYGVRYRIGFSEQSPSTDTLAVDESNAPFRKGDGSLLFRPGGHGALLSNLNGVEADVVFIKNIDNVVPEDRRGSTVIYKKTLGGILVSLQGRIFGYLRLIEGGQYSGEQIQEMIRFLHDELCIRNPKMKHLEDAELILYIRDKLNRPLRVCGMVRNTGEPGGGPYIAVNADGSCSPQILERSQIDTADAAKRGMLEGSTHFNPVDLVCGMRDYKGEKFDLGGYVDKDTGFIVVKSKEGRRLKALELPGLWNGGMSDWNTVFVEVPGETFNPVKTVNDLLRVAHRPKK